MACRTDWEIQLYCEMSGMQQAMDYALILDLNFAYSSNGDAFLEHDFITGKETEIKLEDFPTEEEYFEKRAALGHEIDKTLSGIQKILGIDIKSCN